MLSYYGHRSCLSIAVQAHFLRMAQRYSICRFTGRSGLVWKGEARPTPFSENYRVQISYNIECLPETKVLEPELKGRGKERIPHMYNQTTLCLFNPHKHEWNDGMRIADTILPLAFLWLYFYEIWFATGEWHGEGDHPAPPTRQDPSLRRPVVN